MVAQMAAASQGVQVSLGGLGNTTAMTSDAKDIKAYFTVRGEGMKVLPLELKIITIKDGSMNLSNNTP
jgi:hypothetical protein